MILAPVLAWICPICGYIHYGSEPPDECEVCGAAKEMFMPYEDEKAERSAPDASDRVVIIGAGIAGVSAAEAVRKVSPGATITLISDDDLLPYYRINLTRYLAGELHDKDLTLHPESWYDTQNIHLMMNSDVSAINLETKEISMPGKENLPFDKLIFALGAHPFVPPFIGVDKKNITTLRTLQDADRILSTAKAGTNCVCIGGGILGLENAGALAKRGVNVTIIEDQQWLLSRQLNRQAGEIFNKYVQTLGIHIQLSGKTKELQGDETVQGVLLDNGTVISADMVVISTGVRPNKSVAEEAGIATHLGILVDNHLQTSHPAVYAAGDCAEHNGTLYGTWGPAQMQGWAAGTYAGGGSAEFASLPRSNVLKVLGIDLFSIGEFNPVNPDDVLIEKNEGDKYACYLFRNNALIGSILLGDVSRSGKLKKLIENGTVFADLLPAHISVQQIEAELDAR